MVLYNAMHVKRQTCWADSPDVITLSVSRADKGGIVHHTPVVPSDIIEIPLCDGSKMKYKLSSIICHSGSRSTHGHFWTCLRHGSIVIKADDTRITVIPQAAAKKVTKENGYIYFYVKCNGAPINACITMDDKVENIGIDSIQAQPLPTYDVDVLCNERPNVHEAIPLPILTFLKQTSAFQKGHTRLVAAAIQSPELFRAALEKIKVADTHLGSVVSQPLSVTDTPY